MDVIYSIISHLSSWDKFQHFYSIVGHYHIFDEFGRIVILRGLYEKEKERMKKVCGRGQWKEIFDYFSGGWSNKKYRISIGKGIKQCRFCIFGMISSYTHHNLLLPQPSLLVNPFNPACVVKDFSLRITTTILYNVMRGFTKWFSFVWTWRRWLKAVDLCSVSTSSFRPRFWPLCKKFVISNKPYFFSRFYTGVYSVFKLFPKNQL